MYVHPLPAQGPLGVLRKRTPHPAPPVWYRTWRAIYCRCVEVAESLPGLADPQECDPVRGRLLEPSVEFDLTLRCPSLRLLHGKPGGGCDLNLCATHRRQLRAYRTYLRLCLRHLTQRPPEPEFAFHVRVGSPRLPRAAPSAPQSAAVISPQSDAATRRAYICRRANRTRVKGFEAPASRQRVALGTLHPRAHRTLPRPPSLQWIRHGSCGYDRSRDCARWQIGTRVAKPA